MTKIKLKTYTIIERAVEEGSAYGLNRAHKHTDEPSRDHMATEIERAVMESLNEVIDFDDGYSEE